MVGDLGGGSLELIDVKDMASEGRVAEARLAGADGRLRRSLKNASASPSSMAEAAPFDSRGRTFYAVGGTWRSLAKLHMRQCNYPLEVMHGYVIPARDAVDFASLVERVDTEALVAVGAVSGCAARPGLWRGGAGRDHPRAQAAQGGDLSGGLREGLLYEPGAWKAARRSAAVGGARTCCAVRAPGLRRRPDRLERRLHGVEPIDETVEEKRLRHAACLLSESPGAPLPITARVRRQASPRRRRSIGVYHPGRAFVALAVVCRHEGVDADTGFAELRGLLSTRLLLRARVSGAAMRVAYLLSALMPGVLPGRRRRKVGARQA